MHKTKTIKIVFSALFAALIFVGTQFVRVPLPFGYFNFGDCFVLLSALIIGNPYAVMSSAVGSVLADVLSGYTLYAPATLIVKPLMVIVVASITKLGSDKSKKAKTLLLSAGVLCAEFVMVCGYFLYDIILYGTVGALAALLGNVMQGITACVVSIFLISVFERSKLKEQIKL